MQKSTGLRLFTASLLVPLVAMALLSTTLSTGYAQEETQEQAASEIVAVISDESAGLNNQEDRVVQSWLIVVAVVASIATLVAVSISFYLYRWRRILLAEHPNALVPEEWGAELKSNRKATQDLIASYNQNTQSSSDFLNQHSDAVRQMTETFMTFKKSLDEKDAEIERLRQGYDSHVYRQFLNRFIRVHQSLLDYTSETDVSVSDIRNLSLLFEDAMEESGVALFEPEVGDDIRGLGDRVAENPKILETTDASAHLTIAEVNAPGYEIVNGEQPVVLIPAQVTVYRSSNTGEEA